MRQKKSGTYERGDSISSAERREIIIIMGIIPVAMFRSAPGVEGKLPSTPGADLNIATGIIPIDLVIEEDLNYEGQDQQTTSLNVGENDTNTIQSYTEK